MGIFFGCRVHTLYLQYIVSFLFQPFAMSFELTRRQNSVGPAVPAPAQGAGGRDDDDSGSVSSAGDDARSTSSLGRITY